MNSNSSFNGRFFAGLRRQKWFAWLAALRNTVLSVLLVAGASLPGSAADTIWVDDALPAGAISGADGGDAWTWITSSPSPQHLAKSHQSNIAGGEHQHYFYGATSTLTINTGDKLYAYVYVDSANPPSTVMMQWYDENASWSHQAYWGVNYTGWGPPGFQVSPTVPSPANTWIRLEVAASDVGLEGHVISGMAFTLAGGRATWDNAGKSSQTTTDVVWVEDALPAGASDAGGNDPWNWVSSNPSPFSGTVAHQSGSSSGELDHGFNFAGVTLTPGATDKLFTYVYLATNTPPSEIMVSFNTTEPVNSWEYRAYWGPNNMTSYGTDGTPSRTNMGALPPTGQWVRLEVPASTMNLVGKTLQGMFFSTYGGRATFDRSGLSSGSGGGGGNGTNPPPSSVVDYTGLVLPQIGDHILHVLSPTLLELELINSKDPDPAQVNNWNFVDGSGNYTAPAPTKFTVTINGQGANVQSPVGFKRRPLYAPYNSRDLRIANCLYLQLTNSVADSNVVQVTNPDGSLWASTMQFTNVADPLRYSPAIHVNQEGYLPTYSKKAMIGYYMGSLKEMNISAALGFSLVNVTNGVTVFTGTLTSRLDGGFTYSSTPYQKVLEADFTSFTTPGPYRLKVTGLGASLPFMIDTGIAMDFTRMYALGMYHQRCGTNNVPPYTRFNHGVCHTNLVSIPMPQASYSFTWNGSGESIIQQSAKVEHANNNPGPTITGSASLLYPFQATPTSLNVSGGYHDAGDYSKYTLGVAGLVHDLVFAADNFPRLTNLDNLGIPESGDGKSDILQMAKWQTDFLLKMQDTNDGGFYFLVYPKDSTYEGGPPDSGVAQVVWPKNTSATAAAVAALAETASSPRFKQLYPAASASYLASALKGWTFLTNAFNAHGKDHSYQKLTFYGDIYTHTDEVAWAACELYLATTNAYFSTQLMSWFPNPADPNTWGSYGWEHLNESYGNAIRSYAFANRSGRLAVNQLNASYLALCTNEINIAASNSLAWSGSNAYGTSFPFATKDTHPLSAGWYFSGHQAFDLAVGYQLNPDTNYIKAILANMNYEGGCNPVNVCYDEGLGWKRQREIVHQYAQWGDQRVLPPSGIPVSNIQGGFNTYLGVYSNLELQNATYPRQDAATDPYPMYDRWADDYDVYTEAITINIARGLGAFGFIAAQTAVSNQTFTNITISIVPPSNPVWGQTATGSVQVAGMDMSNARTVWEIQGQEPGFGTGTNLVFKPMYNMRQWIEAEVQWPDGRRAFASNTFNTASATNVVWIDDKLPPGAVVNEDANGTITSYYWNWTTTNSYSGVVAHKLAPFTSGEHQSYFVTPTPTMSVGSSDTIYTWIYIDPSQAAPSEVMVEFMDENGNWNYGAYWGSNLMFTYLPNLHLEGSVPASGTWIKLTVPASDIALGGHSLRGMAFALYNGSATWDLTGKTSP